MSVIAGHPGHGASAFHVHYDSQGTMCVVSVNEQVVLVKMLRTGRTSGNLGQCWKGWDQGSVEGWGDSLAGNSCLTSSVVPIFRTHI